MIFIVITLNRDNITIEFASNHFFDKLKQLRNTPDTTIYSYNRDYKDFERYLESNDIPNDLSNISAGCIEDFLASVKKRGCGINTLHRKKDSLSSLFKHLKKQGWVSRNPVMDIELAPRIKNVRNVFLNLDEIRKLIEVDVEIRGYDPITLSVAKKTLVFTGVRESSLRKLDWEHIDFSKNVINIFKSKNYQKKNNPDGFDRSIPICKSLLVELKNIYFNGASGPVFKNCKGKRMTKDALARLIKRSKEKASIQSKLTPHGIRHNLCSHLEKLGATESDRALLLGHSPSSTTMGYTHSSLDRISMFLDKFSELVYSATNSVEIKNDDNISKDFFDTNVDENRNLDNAYFKDTIDDSEDSSNIISFHKQTLEEAKVIWNKVNGSKPMTLDFFLSLINPS